jgi:hypothetical protein
VPRRSGWIAFVIAIALVGCGGAHHSSRANVPAAGAQTTPATTHIPPALPTSGVLVAMRRFSPKSLLWQTVVVRPDGTGAVTGLIGESAGATQKSFRLSGSHLATLRRLIAAASHARSGQAGRGRPEYIYTLNVPGRKSRSAGGSMSMPLAQVVNFLNRLISRYCC